MSAATYTRSLIVSTNVDGGPYETGVTTSAGNRNHEVCSVNSSTQYAILNISVYNAGGSPGIVSVGTSQFTGSSSNTRCVLYTSIAAGASVERTVYVGPGNGLYWGATTNGMQINVTGVKFVNG